MARLTRVLLALALAAGAPSPAHGADDAAELLKRAEAALSAYPTYILLDGDGVELRRVRGLDERHTVGYRLQRELESVLGKEKR